MCQKEEIVDFFEKLYKSVLRPSFKFIFKNIDIILFMVLSLLYLLFFTTALFLVALSLVFLAIYAFRKTKKFLKLISIVPFLLAFFIFSIRENIYLSLSMLVLAFTLMFFLVNNIFRHTLFNLLMFLILFIAPTKLMFPFLTESIYILFIKTPIDLFHVIFLIIVALFIISSFYFFIRELLFQLSRFNSIRKLNNSYLAIAIVIIILISLTGIWGARQLYTNEYPFYIKLNDTSENIFVCSSQLSYVYLVDMDFMHCVQKSSIGFGFENQTIQNISMKVEKDSIWQNYTLFKDSNYRIENNTIVYMNIPLRKEYRAYNIAISFNKSKTEKGDTLDFVLYGEIKSTDEYDSEIRERMGFIAGIILVSLFSVFSAMSSLKTILKD
jgi:hypothetical protein